ncbi:efflux RND transporter periplasmic adaptor subunit [Hydrogenovibrio halophilus]|uniref:efflux RND transporter periplasmic adaptor subunit n=1 Tax=Hydrogenovibrio halophilus TaxID=373391 RepID=UPI00036116B8|nr:biotin/lipoyl-binding protein [Hydrogenovibrio halophilus]
MKTMGWKTVVTLGLCWLSLNAGAAQTIQIGALVTGQVEEVLVAEGDTVEKGQLLLRIDHPPFWAKLEGAKAQAAAAKARFDDAKIELEQALDLFDRTVTAKRTLDAAQVAHDVAEQSYLKARADVRYYQGWAGYYRVKAPVDATVSAIKTPVGATVFKEHTPMLELTRD